MTTGNETCDAGCAPRDEGPHCHTFACLGRQLAAVQARLAIAEASPEAYRQVQAYVDLQAEAKAAQVRVKELEEDVSQAADPIENMELQHRVDWETELKVAAEKLAASRLELLVAATERAEKAERELIAARELSESRGNHNAKLALERDAAMDGGTQAVWKLRCSRWESKAALMQNERDAYKKALEFTQSESRRLADQAYDLGKERDAAIKAKEEAERARDEHKEFRDDYLKALLDVREERDAERKRADAATAWIAQARTEARREALEAFTGILFEECQPNNGDLFSRVDDRIRALAKEPKP